MDRFLRYSLEKGRRIRVMVLLDGVITQKTVRVLALTDTAATLRIGAKTREIAVADILSCDYARGDHGED